MAGNLPCRGGGGNIEAYSKHPNETCKHCQAHCAFQDPDIRSCDLLSTQQLLSGQTHMTYGHNQSFAHARP